MKLLLALVLLFFTDISLSQEIKTFANRALDKDASLCVNKDNVETCPIVIDGTTAIAELTVEEAASGDCAGGNVCSGTFTPVEGGGTCTSITFSKAMYFKIGDMVYVSGKVIATCTTNQTIISSVPISRTAGNFTDNLQGSGSGLTDGGTSPNAQTIASSSGSENMNMVWRSSATLSGNNVFYSYIYRMTN